MTDRPLIDDLVDLGLAARATRDLCDDVVRRVDSLIYAWQTDDGGGADSSQERDAAPAPSGSTAAATAPPGVRPGTLAAEAAQRAHDAGLRAGRATNALVIIARAGRCFWPDVADALNIKPSHRAGVLNTLADRDLVVRDGKGNRGRGGPPAVIVAYPGFARGDGAEPPPALPHNLASPALSLDDDRPAPARGQPEPEVDLDDARTEQDVRRACEAAHRKRVERAGAQTAARDAAELAAIAERQNERHGPPVSRRVRRSMETRDPLISRPGNATAPTLEGRILAQLTLGPRTPGQLASVLDVKKKSIVEECVRLHRDGTIRVVDGVASLV